MLFLASSTKCIYFSFSVHSHLKGKKTSCILLCVHTDEKYFNNFFSFFSFITVAALSLSFLSFLSSLPQILLSFPFLQILTNQTDCKILNQMCNFQFKHKPINQLLLRASSFSTVSFFLFCCGFFFSYFLCNISLSSCFWVKKKNYLFSLRWRRRAEEERRWWGEEKKR